MTMRSAIRVLAVLTSLCATLSSTTGWASGSYPAKPPKPSAHGRADVDSAKYDLGKRIFSGKAELPKADPQRVESQRATIAGLEAKVPESARRRAHLSDLAGRLGETELSALEYYVITRYKP